MKRLQELDASIDSSRNTSNEFASMQKPKRKYVQAGNNGSYPAIDMSAVGNRHPAPLVGGGKVKRDGNPPAVKKGLKSAGKETMKLLTHMGNDVLDLGHQSSSQMKDKASQQISSAIMQGGKKPKRAGAPPAVKKGMKSVGKETMKLLTQMGNDALDIGHQSSSQMKDKASQQISSAIMQGGKEKKPKQVRTPSKWIEHVKDYSAKNGVSYKDALKLAKDSYKK